MSLSTAHPWSPLSLIFQHGMGLSITSQHVTSSHFTSHHIFHSTCVYGASSSCQTLFQALGTQKENTRVKSLSRAYILVEKRENKQDRCIFKTAINTKKKKIKPGKEVGSVCVWRGMGGQTFKTKSSGSKPCGPVAKEPFEEEAVRGESSEMSSGLLEG